MCESVTGGVIGELNSFISPRVSTDHLRPKEDKPQDNLNNTIYRDQINKIALAIKEIIIGLKTGPVGVVKEKEQIKKQIDKVDKDKKLKTRGTLSKSLDVNF